MAKPLFLYATGTAFFTNIAGQRIGAIGGSIQTITTNGKSYWIESVYQDPFPWMLEEQIWDARKVQYPAAIFPGQWSIDTGVAMTIAHINTVPQGTPFALGGYSQGAAVMSNVYNEIRNGSLTSRQSDFMGAVLFGNPMRQQDFTAPGVTWSGCWDIPGSTTGGSGCFPNRLSNCEYGIWREYVNHDEIIAATGTSFLGNGWRAAAGFLMGKTDPWDLLTNFLSTAMIQGIQAALAIGDVGHVGYPTKPPVTFSGETFGAGAPSCYGMALDFLDEVVREKSTVPIILPPNHPTVNKQWTTVRPIPA